MQITLLWLGHDDSGSSFICFNVVETDSNGYNSFSLKSGEPSVKYSIITPGTERQLSHDLPTSVAYTEVGITEDDRIIIIRGQRMGGRAEDMKHGMGESLNTKLSLIKKVTTDNILHCCIFPKARRNSLGFGFLFLDSSIYIYNEVDCLELCSPSSFISF